MSMKYSSTNVNVAPKNVNKKSFYYLFSVDNVLFILSFLYIF